MARAPVHVIALGACTPIGRDAWSSAAAVRAGVSGFSEHPYMVDMEGEPMRVAFAPWLDIDLPLLDRVEALLFEALDEALWPLVSAAPQGLRIALALGLPLPRPGVPPGFEAAIRSSITRRYGSLLSAIATLPHGHAAGLLGLEVARNKLAEGIYDVCIVAAAESYLDADTLEWLEQCEQLHGAGPLNNAWGFIPGEAAGVVVLATDRTEGLGGLQPMACLLNVATAIEHKRIKTPTVCIGEGLTQALRSALSALPAGSTVSDIYCDMNGEPYRADEFGFATVRTAAGFSDAGRFQAPADCWGDVGAASGPLLICLAIIAHRKGYADGPLALAWASSESGERCAALLQPVQAP